MTSTGVASQYRTVTIPRSDAGLLLLIDAAHQQGPLRLEVPFEVCTLKSSPTSIRRGGAIKLSGIVPTEGHQGTVGGERKCVTVFSRTTAAGQPTVSDPCKRGSKLLKVLRTDRAGAYHSGLLKPARTTWYVDFGGGDGTGRLHLGGQGGGALTARA